MLHELSYDNLISKCVYISVNTEHIINILNDKLNGKEFYKSSYN